MINKKRKRKINKTRRSSKESLKERLRKVDEDPGYGLHYVFKSGKYEGLPINYVIDKDISYMENLLKNTGFQLNKKAFNIYLQTLKKEKERQEKVWEKYKYEYEEESTYTDKQQWGKGSDPWDDFFSRSNSTRNNYRYWYSNHQENTFNSSNSSIIGHKQHGIVLGFEGQVKKSEIKSYYRIAALKWHPDKHNNSQESLEMMKKINNAWDYFKKEYNLV